MPQPTSITPPDIPEATPTRFDNLLRVESLIALHGSVGELKEAVRTLQRSVEKQGDKLDSLSHRMYAASAIIVIVLGFLAWILDKLSPVLLAAIHVKVS